MRTRSSFLSFAPPDIGDAEVAEVVECLRSGWLTTGARVQEFEADFAECVGAEAGLALNSGTAALHDALLVFGVGPGDRVVVPTMTFVSAAHVVEHVGAVPLFIDVEPDTLNLHPDAVDKAVTASEAPVRCVSPVHLYGQPCAMDVLLELVERHNAWLVDDAAHALPARLGETAVGGWSSSRALTAFSFYATKNLTTGEGGMLTGPRDLIDEARAWSLHGLTKDARKRYEAGGSWRYDVTRAGFKYNMSDVQAALGIVQLRRLPEMHRRRRQIASRYTSGLQTIEEVELPRTRPGTDHAWHIYALRLHLDKLKIGRDQFIDELRDRKIGTSVHFIPIHLLAYYRQKYALRPGDFPIATREFERLISLPIHPAMTNGDVDDVVESVTDICSNYRR